MALTNEVQVGRFNGILHKLFAMKEGAPAPVLMPELLAGIILENDRPEWKFLANERMASAGGQTAAVVGELGNFSLHNPADSGALLVVDFLEISQAATSGLVVTGQILTGAPAGTIQSRGTRDTRLGINLVGGTQTGIVGVPRVNTLAVSAITAAQWIWRVPSQSSIRHPLEVVLSPNHHLLFELNQANELLIFSTQWRERALEPSETR